MAPTTMPMAAINIGSNSLVKRSIQRPISPDKRQVLIDALNDQPQRPEYVRKMVQLIVSMPEYQLC